MTFINDVQSFDADSSYFSSFASNRDALLNGRNFYVVKAATDFTEREIAACEFAQLASNITTLFSSYAKKNVHVFYEEISHDRICFDNQNQLCYFSSENFFPIRCQDDPTIISELIQLPTIADYFGNEIEEEQNLMNLQEGELYPQKNSNSLLKAINDMFKSLFGCASNNHRYSH